MAIAGSRAPYVRLFFGDQEITIQIDNFKYTYSEEEDDICTLAVQSGERDIADKPQFQLLAQLKVVWGYIGEPTTIKSRLIYVQDLQWQYGENVNGIITCCNKAKSLSFDSTPAVYNNQTLPEIANSIAKKNDIKLKVGVLLPDDPSPAQKVSDLVSAQDKRRVSALKQVFIDFDTWNKTYNTKDKSNWKYNSQQTGDIKNIDSTTELPKNFNIYKSIPKGRQTDRVFLEKLAMKEPGGNTIIDTRDDEIIIRKRNFAQRPYKNYNYSGEPNEIKEFTAEYKNRRRAATAGNVAFTGWNRETKEYYEGNTNALLDNSTDALGRIQGMAEYLKTLPQNEPSGTFELDPLTGKMRYNRNKVKKAFINPRSTTGQGAAYEKMADETNAFKDVRVPVTVGEDLEALNRVIANQTSKGPYDATANNPYDAFNNAANGRNNAELNKNPAVLEVEGDTAIGVGILVTVSGVAKQHSGNYYVIQTQHSIGDDGYTTEMQLVRDGSNYIRKGAVDVTKFGKKHNSFIGHNSIRASRTVKSRKQ